MALQRLFRRINTGCVHRQFQCKLFSSDANADLFEGKIEGNGLPYKFEWKFICPVKFDALELVDDKDKTYYCDECKHNVYTVRNTEELKQRVSNEECVTFEFLDESMNDVHRSLGIANCGTRLLGRIVRALKGMIYMIGQNKGGGGVCIFIMEGESVDVALYIYYGRRRHETKYMDTKKFDRNGTNTK
eukprot:206662_1